MSCFVYFLWIICKIFVNFLQPAVMFNVTWETDTRIIRIGETFVITCTVLDEEVIDPGETRQWSKESSIICYNGQVTNPLKYMENLNRNQFQLFIYNTTESDLNCEYKCLYGFDTYSKILNITEENFEYIPTLNTSHVELNYKRNGNLKVELHMKKVFPHPNCTVSIKGLQLTFGNSTCKKNGFYFEVRLVHQSNHQLKTDTSLNVTCKLLHQGQEYVIATRTIYVDNDVIHITDQEMVSSKFVLIILVVFATLAALGGLCCSVVWCMRVYRRQITKSFKGDMIKETEPLGGMNKGTELLGGMKKETKLLSYLPGSSKIEDISIEDEAVL